MDIKVQKYLKYSVTGAWWLIGHQGVQTEKQNKTEQERNVLRRRQKRWCHLGRMTRSPQITWLEVRVGFSDSRHLLGLFHVAICKMTN